MKIINGNILDMTDGIIVHQVNCKGVMGAGLALQIKNKWPKVFKEYTEHIKYCSERLNKHPLGTINGTSVSNTSKFLMVYNFYSQDNYGRNGIQTNYEAFEKCLIGLVKRFENSKVPIDSIPVYFPYGIGCGLAGGDWKVISKMIEKHFPQAIIVKLG
ncbi:MAG: macro domain-containing protein [Cetobacterium sp.]